MAKKSVNRMSVRLDEESNIKLENAAKTGISKNAFINQAIHEASLTEQRNRRDVQPHLANLQSLLEFCECRNAETKEAMREELHYICQYLRS